MMSELIKSNIRKKFREIKEFNFTETQVTTSANGSILDEFRRLSWEIYKHLPFPTTEDEPWRRTNIKGLKTDAFYIPVDGNVGDLPEIPEYLMKPLVGEIHGGFIAIQPEKINIQLNPRLSQQGVIFTDLTTANEKYPDYLAKILGKVVRPEEGKFSALASAMAKQGVFIYVPEGVHVEQPLHSVLWAAGINLAYFSQILIYLEDRASLTFVHESASPNQNDGQTLHAGIVAIHVGAESQLRYIELQSLGNHVWNFMHERVQVERDGNIDWVFGAVGSRLTKNFSDLDLIGNGATGKMSGFYFTDGNQHLDHDTQQNHLAPFTTSDLLFKGALKGHSRSVWQGMVYVANNAQRTDGYQANRNLILSKGARADSIPGLEILADDVRCSHGATVGKIDPEMIFYLQSRGILPIDAERLIVEGFFEPIMQRIPYEGVRKRFQESIENKMA
ncbi:MAG TPA: Fe-S cluster assembly protein SufD [Anaerolineae bacterium]|nr:Fe-S cluster assembly protein SufD [Anaerolineae bacterium]